MNKAQPVELQEQCARWRMPRCFGIWETLLATTSFFLSLAAMVTVGLYIILFGTHNATFLVPIAGTLAVALVAVVNAVINRKSAAPGRVDPRLYGEIKERLISLDARLECYCRANEPQIKESKASSDYQTACALARAHRDFIQCEMDSLGVRWVQGTGYVDLWSHIHSAEEMLFLVAPLEEVLGDACFDDLRLEGAVEIKQWSTLQTKSGEAVKQLTAAGGQGLDHALALVKLRNIRHVINEARDRARANLIAARNRLVWTGTITGIAAYLLLMLAMVDQAPPSSIVSAVGLYLVGATVGLFSQLRRESKMETGEEDYGFARARLFYTPVLSGLAALGGVVVVALLGESNLVGSMSDNATGSLPDIFNVEQMSLSLVVAAVFGLTPDLLVSRLQASADQSMQGLKNMSAMGGGASGAGGAGDSR